MLRHRFRRVKHKKFQPSRSLVGHALGSGNPTRCLSPSNACLRLLALRKRRLRVAAALVDKRIWVGDIPSLQIFVPQWLQARWLPGYRYTTETGALLTAARKWLHGSNDLMQQINL